MADSLRELRRSQIISVARQLVAEEGLEGLTIAVLESRLDFTRGVITYHFESKDDIVEGVLQSAIDEISAATKAEVEASLTPHEKIAAVIRTNLRGFLEHPEAARILLSFWGRLGSDARIRKVNAKLYAHYRKQASRLLEAGIAEGIFPQVSPDGMASLLVGLVIGIACQHYFESGAIDTELALREAIACMQARLTLPPG